MTTSGAAQGKQEDQHPQDEYGHPQEHDYGTMGIHIEDHADPEAKKVGRKPRQSEGLKVGAGHQSRRGAVLLKRPEMAEKFGPPGRLALSKSGR